MRMLRSNNSVTGIIIFLLWAFKSVCAVHPKPPVAESSCSNAKSNLGGNITCANVLSVFGRNATLNCNYNEAAGDKISWIRYDTRTIISMHDVKVTQSERYALEKIEGSIELIITNVTETDAGIYICQLNSEPIQNHVIDLQVMRPPWNITTTLPSDKVDAQVGRSVGLMCSAQGNPKPSITWKRYDKKPMRIRSRMGKDRVLEFEGEELVLRDIRRGDAGLIYCIANNGYPPLVSRQFQIDVTYPPKAVIHIEPVGDSFKIVCSIVGYPIPSRYSLTIQGQDTDIIPNRQGSNLSKFELIHLGGPKSKYYGQTVECFAKNNIGEDIARELITYGNKGQAQSPRKIATTPKPSLTVFSTRGRYWSATGWPPKQDVRQKYEYEYNNENSFGKSSKDSRGKDIRRKTEGIFNHASMKCLSSRFSLVLIVIHAIFKKLC